MQTVTVAVRDDDGQKETIAVGPAFAEAIQRAAAIANQEDLPLSFASLLLGMLTSRDDVAAWLEHQLSDDSVLWLLRRVRSRLSNLNSVRAYLQEIPPAAEVPHRTTSVKAAMNEAQRIADGLSATVETRHLLAAYLMLPHYHDDDFQQLGVERSVWAESLSRAMMTRYPREESFWTGFPSTVSESQRGSPPKPDPAPSPPAAAERVDPRAATENLDLGNDKAIRMAIEIAFALAGGDRVRPSHVLRAACLVSAPLDSGSLAFEHFSQLVPLREPGSPPNRSTSSSLDSGRLDEALRRHLEFARRPLGIEREPTELWGRDLITSALLCSREAATLLEQAGRTIEEVREHWYAFVCDESQQMPEHRTRTQWTAWWRYAGVPLPVDRVRAGYATETDVGKDKLGIVGEARAFARLILDRKVEAPLSIGLLGDWGSGKSFFIEQVKVQIQELRKERHPDLYHNPIEIEFNAWHASDSNLWASLVTHIFDEIWQKVSPTGKEKPEVARRRLLAQIEEAKGAVHEAEAQVEHGRVALAKAEESLAQKQADLAWDKVVKTEAKGRLHEIAEAAGWHEPLATINSVEAAARALGASGNRLRRAIGSLLEHPFRYIAAPTIGLAVLAAVLWFALGAQPSFGAQVAKWLGSIAGAIGALTAPLGLANRKVTALADQLRRIRDKYDAAVTNMPAEEKERLAASRRELDSAEASVAAAKSRLADLLSQQAALDPRRRLGAFLQERVQSTVYRSQQGIISLVYKDFEQLSRYMKELRDEQANGKSLDDGNIRAFDRIVIYVDDLDRCRPAHVVTMLEAVHLLLALDLFIVIVAVDSRWLTRALEVHYKDLLDVADGADGMRTSTPQSYLEKIFQITYALRPMDPTYFRDYVEFLAGAQAADDKPVRNTPAGRSISSAPADNAASAGVAPTSTTSAAASGGAVSRLGQTVPERPASPPAVLPSQPVVITKEEQDLIWLLQPLLPTPRIAKRLVNVYRVIKASTSIAGDAHFEQARSPSCLLMLAILFGRPGIAGELLRSLHEGVVPFDASGTRLVDAIATRAAKSSDALLAQWQSLHETLTALQITATVGECAREPVEIARYSLVTGHDWHTWANKAQPSVSPSPRQRGNDTHLGSAVTSG